MSKTKIIERLLESKHITVEEAVILLEKEVVQVPINQPIYYPPIWYQNPYEVTC